jgi:hypothetical protein
MEACLLIRCLAMDVLLRAFASAGMCLPSRFLAVALSVTEFISSRYKIQENVALGDFGFVASSPGSSLTKWRSAINRVYCMDWFFLFRCRNLQLRQFYNEL